MYDDDKLKEIYTDFVINKYLKILDTKWFAKTEWKTVVAKIADIGSVSHVSSSLLLIFFFFLCF